jgi:hypothetical protein
MQKTGRASYIAVDPSYGSLSAWLNGCTDLAPPQLKQNWAIIYRAYATNDKGKYFVGWHVLDVVAKKPMDVCDGKSYSKEQQASVETNYPPEISEFTSHGVKGCTYKGSAETIGHLRCPGIRDIKCIKGNRDVLPTCTYIFGGGTFALDMTEVIKCSW